MGGYATGVSMHGFGGRRKFPALLVAGAFAALMFTAPSAMATNCSTTKPRLISSCCTIVHHGGYTLTGNLTSTSGTCIKVTVPDAIIDMSDFSITNTGTAGTGTAIHVLAAAANAIIVGDFPFVFPAPAISNFNVGIQSDAANVAILDVATTGNNKGIVINGLANEVLRVDASSNLKNGIQLNRNAIGDAILISSADSNSGSGVVLNGASSTFIFKVEANTNTKFGFLLNGASGNNLVQFSADSNQGGVMLGCHSTGLSGAPCPVASKRNTIVGGQLRSSTTDSHADSNTDFGVGIEVGSKRNHIAGVEGSGNPANSDAIDKNPACGTDFWIGNDFASTSPPFESSPGCID